MSTRQGEHCILASMDPSSADDSGKPDLNDSERAYSLPLETCRHERKHLSGMYATGRTGTERENLYISLLVRESLAPNLLLGSLNLIATPL